MASVVGVEAVSCHACAVLAVEILRFPPKSVVTEPFWCGWYGSRPRGRQFFDDHIVLA